MLLTKPAISICLLYTFWWVLDVILGTVAHDHLLMARKKKWFLVSHTTWNCKFLTKNGWNFWQTARKSLVNQLWLVQKYRYLRNSWINFQTMSTCFIAYQVVTLFFNWLHVILVNLHQPHQQVVDTPFFRDHFEFKLLKLC